METSLTEGPADHYTSGKETFETITLEGYDHSIYNVDKQNTIIVGSPTITMMDKLISFSYIFAINFLVMALFFLALSSSILGPTLTGVSRTGSSIPWWAFCF